MCRHNPTGRHSQRRPWRACWRRQHGRTHWTRATSRPSSWRRLRPVCCQSGAGGTRAVASWMTALWSWYLQSLRRRPIRTVSYLQVQCLLLPKPIARRSGASAHFPWSAAWRHGASRCLSLACCEEIRGKRQFCVVSRSAGAVPAAA